MSKQTIIFSLAVFSTARIAAAQIGNRSVVGSPHDLSATGPGPIHAVEEDEVCIFCHAPHHATGQTPLWNRFDRNMYYSVYHSTTTDARIDQPSGPSKMCLSCHDGAVAVGLVASRPRTEPIVTTFRTIPPGPSDLTEDLSDDHPIGFRFDLALYNRDRQLKNPDVVTNLLPMGLHGEVHCTTCHEPHDNTLGNFLREPTVRSTICLSCHDMFGWTHSSHAASNSGIPGRTVDPRELLPYSSVSENGCTSCHKVHSANSPQWLLRFPREEDNCLNCHRGGVATTNIESDLHKRSVHPVWLTQGRHDPTENPRTQTRHVECADCHNPHAVDPLGPDLSNKIPNILPKAVGPTMQFVTGLDRAGRSVQIARYEYEVCFKCHADGITRNRFPDIQRQVHQTNTRLEFQPGNPSFHPVIGPRRNPDVVSLIPPMQSGSVIACTECHNSDNAATGTTSLQATGPHGSIYSPILIDNYETGEFVTESPRAYALCYRCHERQSILGDESFPLHSEHIVRGRASCATCHDPHGISRTQGSSQNHSNLINFDLNVVRPAGSVGARIIFEDRGTYQGSCTLTCHGVTHVGFGYSR